MWRSVKYEEVCLKAYVSIAKAKREIGKYFAFFNQRRRHLGIGNHRPDALYYAGQDSRHAA